MKTIGLAISFIIALPAMIVAAILWCLAELVDRLDGNTYD